MDGWMRVVPPCLPQRPLPFGQGTCTSATAPSDLTQADDMEAALAEYEEAKTAFQQFIGAEDEFARLKARRDTVHPSVPAVCVRAQCR